MQAGLLNRRVTIQKRGTERTPNGQPIGWVDYVQVWADIRGKSGLQTIRSETPVSVGTYSVRIRYREDIDASMRLVYGGITYEITAVLPDLAGRDYVDLICEARGQHG